MMFFLFSPFGFFNIKYLYVSFCEGMYPSRSGTEDQVQMAEKMTQTDLFHNGVKVNLFFLVEI